MKTELNKFNNDVVELIPLTEFSYEQIFKVYKDGDHYAFNLLRKITIPEDIDESFFDYVEVTSRMPWTLISYKEYGTILLWWLICAVNKVSKPTQIVAAGTILKIIKPGYVRLVIDEIKKQVNK